MLKVNVIKIGNLLLAIILVENAYYACNCTGYAATLQMTDFSESFSSSIVTMGLARVPRRLLNRVVKTKLVIYLDC